MTSFPIDKLAVIASPKFSIEAQRVCEKKIKEEKAQ